MVTQAQTAYFLFFYLLALLPCAVAQTASAEVITARMAQALTKNRAHFRPYGVTRDYKLFGKEKGTLALYDNLPLDGPEQSPLGRKVLYVD